MKKLREKPFDVQMRWSQMRQYKRIKPFHELDTAKKELFAQIVKSYKIDEMVKWLDGLIRRFSLRNNG